jgi:hypothetical protein
MSLESFGQVARWLREAKGFKQVRATRPSAKAFRGEISCRGEAVTIRFEISDWDFVAYPRIFLETIPQALRGFRPHVMAAGDFCYLRKREILLNRYKPVEAVARCLLEAEKTLLDLSSQTDFTFDVQDEFGFYWTSGNGEHGTVLTGSVDVAQERARLVFVEGDDRKSYVLTQDGSEPKWLAACIGGVVDKDSEIPVWLIRADGYPSIEQAGLPGTVKETLSWLKRWDLKAHKQVERILEQREYLRFGGVAFMFASPVGWFGFSFPLDAIHRRSYVRKPALYRQYLYGKGSTTPVRRFYGIDISPTFVHTRNIQSESLIDKRITVIGCGAIGGYVAHSLARLGAGVGPKGRLTLIDEDNVEGGNLGRHVLGFRAILKPKARALQEHLLQQFPYLSVRSLQQDARTFHRLYEDHLVIDATGEEPFSISLNESHQAAVRKSSSIPPILYVWVAGNGDAVQGLFVDNTKRGCYRCMWYDDSRGVMKERFPLLKSAPNVRYQGCQSVTMFPVSAVMSAAALATDVVVDWLAGKPSPRFRTRARENADVFGVKNQDFSALKTCPACQGI